MLFEQNSFPVSISWVIENIVVYNAMFYNISSLTDKSPFETGSYVAMVGLDLTELSSLCLCSAD